MDDLGAFLARVIPLLRGEVVAMENGDPGPRKALWSHEDPVTLFGAEASASGWEALEPIFNRLAQSLSNGQSCTYDVVGAGVSGDLGYVAAIERGSRPTPATPPPHPPSHTVLAHRTLCQREACGESGAEILRRDSSIPVGIARPPRADSGASRRAFTNAVRASPAHNQPATRPRLPDKIDSGCGSRTCVTDSATADPASPTRRVQKARRVHGR